MKHSSLKVFILALTLILLSFSAAHAEEYFKNFDVTIKINKDGAINVTENITANVENININRGIKRAFPVDYRDKDGNDVTVGFEVSDVRLDGKPVDYSVDKDGRFEVVRIGSPNRIIPVGLHTFTIEYVSTKQIGFYEKFDGLFWNVTGNQWTFPIANASCKAALPGMDYGTGFDSIEWYVGAYGERGRKSDAKLGASNKVSTTIPLNPGEGLSVAYTWPKGLVSPPPPPEPENEPMQAAMAALTFLAIASWFFFAWNKWGKEPAKKAVIPIFYPPNGESPAYMRFARNLTADNTAFSAALLNLAVKGVIKIEESEREATLFGRSKGIYTLERISYDTKNLTSDEENLVRNLFENDEKFLTLSPDNGEQISNAMLSLGEDISAYKEDFYRSHAGTYWIGILIYIAGVAALYPFSGDFLGDMVVCAVIGGVIITNSFLLPSKPANSVMQTVLTYALRMIPAIGVTAAILYIGMDDRDFFLVFVLYAAAAIVITVMKQLVAARTKAGMDALSDAEGLALYMGTAEKERLELFNPPEETPQLFEKLMPYALALDTAKTWGNKFEKILKDANYKPEWYTGPDPFIFMYAGGLGSFASDIAGSIAETLPSQTTMEAPGSSSGFGGGGFSGGGGGGGGGSGW